MRILDRYIGRNVAASFFIVMLVMLSLFTIFAFMDELRRIGRGQYDTLTAIHYILLTTPRLAYQLFPTTVLIGCTIGLGMLASHSELVSMRAAGVSLARIIGSVMKVGVLLIAAFILVGEVLAPMTERDAQELRSVALSDKLDLGGDSGLWARDKNTFINIQRVLPGERLGDVYIYELDDAHRVTKMQFAQSAVYTSGRWMLENVQSSEIAVDRIVSQMAERLPWKTDLSPDLLGVVTVKPNTLSVLELYDYVKYLQENGLDAAVYEQAFWGKLLVPLVATVMILLSVSFIFGPLRSVGAGHRILTGALVGVGFFVINQVFTYVGIVFSFNPIVTAVLPAAFAAVLAVVLLKRVH